MRRRRASAGLFAAAALALGLLTPGPYPPAAGVGSCAGSSLDLGDVRTDAARRFIEHLLGDVEGQFSFGPAADDGSRPASLCEIVLGAAGDDVLMIPRLDFRIAGKGDRITLSIDDAGRFDWRLLRLGKKAAAGHGDLSFRLRRSSTKAPVPAVAVIDGKGDLRSLDIAIEDVKSTLDAKRAAITTVSVAAAVERGGKGSVDVTLTGVDMGEGKGQAGNWGADITKAAFQLTLSELDDWRYVLSLFGPLSRAGELMAEAKAPIANDIMLAFEFSGNVDPGMTGGRAARLGTVSGSLGVSGLKRKEEDGAISVSLEIKDGDVKALGVLPSAALPTGAGFAIEVRQLASDKLWALLRSSAGPRKKSGAGQAAAVEAFQNSLVETGAQLIVSRLFIAMEQATLAAKGEYGFTGKAPPKVVGQMQLRLTGLDEVMASITTPKNQPDFARSILETLMDTGRAETKGGVTAWHYDIRSTADGKTTVNGEDLETLFNSDEPKPNPNTDPDPDAKSSTKPL